MNTKETRLQQEIVHLRTRLLVMCAAVGIAVEDACAALARGDVGRAMAVVAGDSAINHLENEIDDAALSLLALQQPVAQDLRFIVGALRMVNDLERIGDEAVSIAERAMVLHEALPESAMEAISALMHRAVSVYAEAVAAFRAGDDGKAMALCRNGDESSQMEVSALQRIMEHFCSEGKAGQTYSGMHGILICRSLTRICRRSENIAEHTCFIVNGVNLRHMA